MTVQYSFLAIDGMFRTIYHKWPLKVYSVKKNVRRPRLFSSGLQKEKTKSKITTRSVRRLVKIGYHKPPMRFPVGKFYVDGKND